MATSSSSSRICRALKLVGIAISHILAGYPDASRTALNAAWEDLKDSPVERIEHMVASAFIAACEGNVRQATSLIKSVQQQLHEFRRLLPHEVHVWIQNTLYETMRRLPYARQLYGYLRNIRTAHTRKDFGKALCLLDEATAYLSTTAGFVPLDLQKALDNAWCAILSDMIHDDKPTWNHTTLRGLSRQRAMRATAAAL